MTGQQPQHGGRSQIRVGIPVAVALVALLLGMNMVEADQVRGENAQVKSDAAPKTTRAKVAKHRCAREIASKVSFSELRVVGAIKQGHKRSLLIMDTANRGHVVFRGDCVGRERVPYEKVIEERSILLADSW